jgi:hypothetical protein
MGKYFGREPRYSREEIERQAQEAIDARVSMGRPPAEDWLPLDARLAELDAVMAARAVVPDAQPLQIREVRVTAAMAPAPAPAPPARQRVGARSAD